MGNETLKYRFEKYLIERKAIHQNDSHAIYKKWDELIQMLTENEKETLELLNNSTKEEIDWISEVMEEVSGKLNSKEYIESLKYVNMKYPECKLDYIVEISIKHMKNKNET